MYHGLIGYPRRAGKRWESRSMRYAPIVGDGLRVAFISTTGETAISIVGGVALVRSDHTLAAVITLPATSAEPPGLCFVPSSGLLFVAQHDQVAIIDPKTRLLLSTLGAFSDSADSSRPSLCYVPSIDAVVVAKDGSCAVFDASTGAMRPGRPSGIKGSVCYSHATGLVYGLDDASTPASDLIGYDPETWTLIERHVAAAASNLFQGIAELPNGKLVVGAYPTGSSIWQLVSLVASGVAGGVTLAGGVIASPGQSRGVAYCPTDDSVYIALGDANTVHYLGGPTLAGSGGAVATAASADGCGYSPLADVMYVAADGAATAWAISPATHTIVATIAL